MTFNPNKPLLVKLQPVERNLPASPSMPSRRQFPDRTLPRMAVLTLTPKEQYAGVGERVEVPPRVCLLNGLADPISNVNVTFTIEPGPKSELDRGLQTLTILTDKNGEAQVPSWTLIEAGEHWVAASAGNLQQSVVARTV